VRRRNTKPEVLVFDHPLDEGGFMVQLPAGTIEQDEEPELAAARELREETGVQAALPSLTGVRDEEWEGEARRRWIYLLRCQDAMLLAPPRKRRDLRATTALAPDRQRALLFTPGYRK
jgi:8-oxo-dGTP pyrophosphatase MutT (NUDIX family)